MKTFIQKDASAKVGYSLIDVDDNGIETKKTLEWSKLPGNVEFRLPENFANRQYFKLSGLKGRDKVELPYHETRILGNRENRPSTPKISKFDEMLNLAESDEEKALIIAMKKRAEEKAERENLEREIENLTKKRDELQAKLDALNAQ